MPVLGSGCGAASVARRHLQVQLGKVSQSAHARVLKERRGAGPSTVLARTCACKRHLMSEIKNIMPSPQLRDRGINDPAALLTFDFLPASGAVTRLAVAKGSETLVQGRDTGLEERQSLMDRRQARRFEMCAPVIFTWTDGEGRRRESAGFSRNISAGGVFVVSHTALPAVSASMELHVVLPSLSSRSRDMELMAQGIVARVEKLADGAGLGIASPFGMVGDSEVSNLCPLRHGKA